MSFVNQQSILGSGPQAALHAVLESDYPRQAMDRSTNYMPGEAREASGRPLLQGQPTSFNQVVLDGQGSSNVSA